MAKTFHRIAKGMGRQYGNRNMKGIWTESAGMNDSYGASEWGIMGLKKKKKKKEREREGQISNGKVCIYDNQTASVSILFTKI